jgi:hypothetical protein
VKKYVAREVNLAGLCHSCGHSMAYHLSASGAPRKCWNGLCECSGFWTMEQKKLAEAPRETEGTK